MDLNFGPFRLSEHDRALVGPSGPVELSGRSFDLLKTFLERPNELVTKSDLLDAVWPGVVVEENTLQVHMSALRKALGQGYIATVHGRGYRYVGPLPEGGDFPGAAVSATDGTGNLGRYQVECVAREAERTAVRELLQRQRLVSILGPGGVGKTTLALAVAADAAADFEGGVWVIDLAPLAEGSLVESAIIQTLGIPFRANVPPIRAIAEAIREKSPLLVLDNCEHIAPSVARVAKALLADVPSLKVLATTQVPLGISEEHLFKLGPFALADADDAQSAQFLAYCYEALGETLTPEELPIVAQLCRRLDGVALALKMAAARAATLGIAAVDKQIEEQLASLSAGWEPSLERHRSLTASLTWSYELLSDADRGTLRALGVFQGSFTLAGARAVASLTSDDSVAELVRRSMVVRDGAGRTRYRLLETTRHFALARLTDAGEEAAVRSRHAGHILGVFNAALEAWETTPDVPWLAALQPDADNLRSALEWTRLQADWPVHVGLTACSYRFWIQTQLPSEGLRYAEAASAHAGNAGKESRALLALALAEFYRFYRLDYRVLEHLKTAGAFYLNGADKLKQLHVLILEGWSLQNLHGDAPSHPIFARVTEVVADLPTSKLKARTLVLSGMDRWSLGDELVGRNMLEAGLAMHVATGNTRGYWKSVMLSAEVMYRNGYTEDAIELSTRVLPELRARANAEELAGQLGNLCVYHMSRDEYEIARPMLAECASRMPRDDKNGMWCVIQNCAELFVHDGKLEAAALLLGHADAGFASWEDGRQQTEVMQRARIETLLGASGMSAGERDRLLDQGGRMSPFEAELLAGINRGAGG